MPKEDLPKNQPSESRDLVRAGIGGRENLSLPAEVIQALESTSSSVDINVLLVQMIQKDPDPSEFLEQFEKIIGLVQRVEAGRLENFRERANAVIDAKTRDPDEMDKRANNSTRRFLKHVLGVMAPASLTISVVGFWLQAPAIVMVGSLSVTALCVTIAGILASGESVTTSDMVQILRELTRGLKMKPSPGESASRSGSRKKGKEER